MPGGRRRPRGLRPGNTSPGEVKKTVKPRVKKFGVSPGAEKMSRGTRKCSLPTSTKISDSKSWDWRRGTDRISRRNKSRCQRLTTVKLSVSEKLDELLAICRTYEVACHLISVLNPWGGGTISSTLEMARNGSKGFRISIDE